MFYVLLYFKLVLFALCFFITAILLTILGGLRIALTFCSEIVSKRTVRRKQMCRYTHTQVTCRVSIACCYA